jgi:hypothetical protein
MLETAEKDILDIRTQLVSCGEFFTQCLEWIYQRAWQRNVPQNAGCGAINVMDSQANV